MGIIGESGKVAEVNFSGPGRDGRTTREPSG